MTTAASGPIQTTSKSRKSLATSNEVYGMIKQIYRNAWQAKEEGRKVAWLPFGIPLELLYAMDVAPVFIEQFASVTAAKKAAVDLCEIAEADGYSVDLCSYARSTIGYAHKMIRGEIDTSLAGGIPAPDLLIASSTICDPRIKWFEALIEYFDIPLFVLDVHSPPGLGRREEPSQRYVDYFVSQMPALVEFLEAQTGKKLEMNRLREAVANADRAAQLWKEVYELRKSVPSPMGTEDLFTAMVPIMNMSGTKGAVDFYQKIRDEVAARVANKQGVIRDERYRLLWSGLPPWFNLGLLNYFQDAHQAVFAIETSYYRGNPIRFDPEKPFESLAREYCRQAGGADQMIDLCSDLIAEYQIDGVVMHNARSCKAASYGQAYAKDILAERLGVPTLIIESDMVDERNYSDADVKWRIDSFMETVRHSKR